jgi:hypothetical protein
MSSGENRARRADSNVQASDRSSSSERGSRPNKESGSDRSTECQHGQVSLLESSAGRQTQNGMSSRFRGRRRGCSDGPLDVTLSAVRSIVHWIARSKSDLAVQRRGMERLTTELVSRLDLDLLSVSLLLRVLVNHACVRGRPRLLVLRRRIAVRRLGCVSVDGGKGRAVGGHVVGVGR